MKQVGSLAGKRVVLTRNSAGNSRLADALAAHGAEVLNLPLIEIHMDLDTDAAADVFREFASYEWLIFTSRNGVNGFFSAFLRIFADIRSLGFIRIAAVGEGTAEALQAYHLVPDLLADVATGEQLAQQLAETQSLDNLKVLVITGNRNREDLLHKLWQERAIVDTLRVYRSELCDLAGNPAAERFCREGGDALIFASASAVQAFGEQAAHLRLQPTARRPALCSFGPSTSARMKAASIPVAVEAEQPGIAGMVAALVAYFARG